MEEQVISSGELLLVLFVYAGPLYIAAAALLLAWLRRRRHGAAKIPLTRVVLTISVALFVSVGLTVVLWWATGFLPEEAIVALSRLAIPDDTMRYVTPSALAATTICFGAAAWFLAWSGRSMRRIRR